MLARSSVVVSAHRHCSSHPAGSGGWAVWAVGASEEAEAQVGVCCFSRAPSPGSKAMTPESKVDLALPLAKLGPIARFADLVRGSAVSAALALALSVPSASVSESVPAATLLVTVPAEANPGAG